jgi:hypothetical protein
MFHLKEREVEMPTGELTSTSSPEGALVIEIGPTKVIDLMMSKQTQYYTLWAVYTAVQFAAGGYGLNTNLSLATALAVLVGVWTFNLGHLGFVLQCVNQLNQLTQVLDAALRTPMAYGERLRKAVENIQEGSLFWAFLKRGEPRSYIGNIAVHLLIDTCASVALLTRVPSVSKMVGGLFG